MLLLRRNGERRNIQSGKSTIWLTFFPQGHADILSEGFGVVSILNEIRLQPGEGAAPEQVGETDLVTYAYKGAVALKNPEGRCIVVTAGEFQCMTIGRVPSHRAMNTSPTDPAHFFRMYLRLLPSQHGLDSTEAPTRFTAAERRNMLCTVASPDGRKASLHIHPDAHVYSSILDSGQHIVYELRQGRRVWLHMIYGEGNVNGANLAQGDGVGIVDERSVSLTALENSEMLMVDTISNAPKEE
jgi:redox-sensitive bicupin YhaK (pirin superfamily)